MKKILLAENTPDGLIASLYLQERFQTCDPLFGESPLVLRLLASHLFSGIPTKGGDVYRQQGEYEEKDRE